MTHPAYFAGLIALFAFVGCSALETKRYPAVPSMQERFLKADVDGNGLISRDEFVNSMITDAFTLMDKNGNGTITLEEYVAGGGTAKTFRTMNTTGDGRLTLAQALASPLARERMALPFDEADTNKNGSISRAEFEAYLERAQPYIR